MAEMSSEWYGLTFAASSQIIDSSLIEVAGFIEGTSQSRIFGITSSNALMLENTIDMDIASVLKKLGVDKKVM